MSSYRFYHLCITAQNPTGVFGKFQKMVSNLISLFKSPQPLSIFCVWHQGDSDFAPTGHDLMSDIKNNYIICLNPEGWLGMDSSSSPKCHPVMSSGQRYTVRTVPAGTWDARWPAFYPKAIWTQPVFFVNTAVHNLHTNRKQKSWWKFYFTLAEEDNRKCC